jgi:hypothetical protein
MCRAARNSSAVLPPSDGGPYCRDDVLNMIATVDLACSRRPAAGSIAARACRRPAASWRPVLPAVRRRAPLRPDRVVVRGVHTNPCSRRSTAGSIAAARILAESCNRCHVLPSLSGGLHCGLTRRKVFGPAGKCSRPINGGLHCGQPFNFTGPIYKTGAPAARRWLHCGYCCAPATGVMVTCVPAGRRRAPLRRHPLLTAF